MCLYIMHRHKKLYHSICTCKQALSTDFRDFKEMNCCSPQIKPPFQHNV